MKEKGDECIFVGYFTQSRAYRVFNKRTRVIMESIHVNFNELPQMVSDQLSSDPAPECQSMALNHDSLSPEQVQRSGRTEFIATIHQKTDPTLLQFCLFSCFLSQVEPKNISDALQDLSWVEAIQEELLRFKIQNVWTLVDCPKRVRPIRTKCVLKNKKDERGIIIRNKARLVAQGHTQE
nr:hypothetical protein [Tanacetum cinerariifolium]